MKSPRRFLLLALAALAYTGCAEPGTPVTPQLPAFDVGVDWRGRDGPPLGQLATFQSRAPHGVAQKWIGPRGGRLELHGFAIDVPAGAVERPHLFTIRLPESRRAAKRVMADFGPHGARFERPVAIELPYAGTSIAGSEGVVVWWNRKAREWVDVGGSVTEDGRRLRTTTDHFSIYGTARLWRSGGVTVSGG